MKYVMFKAKDQGWRQMTFFEGDHFDSYKDWIYQAFRNTKSIPGKKVIARALEQFDYQEDDADRAIRELEQEGKLFALKSGKKKAWDWLLMFDCP